MSERIGPPDQVTVTDELPPPGRGGGGWIQDLLRQHAGKWVLLREDDRMQSATVSGYRGLAWVKRLNNSGEWNVQFAYRTSDDEGLGQLWGRMQPVQRELFDE